MQGPFEYRRHANGMVHRLFLDYRGAWRWPQGHVDAQTRTAKPCEEAPVTCLTCLTTS
jgi:hypothetical protein